MPEARNGEVTLYFEDEGTGKPVLLIHGHTLDRRVWEPVMPTLHSAGCRVLRPDLRGHGLSTRPEGGYHVSHHATDLEAVLDAAGVVRTTVVGFSIGGGIALEMALTMPARVGAMVLLSPVVPDRPFEPAFMDNLREVARVARGEGIEAAMRGPWARSPLFANSFAKPGVREQAAAILRDFPGAEYLASRRDHIAREWTVPERLSEIGVPTRVLVGELEMPGFRAFAEEAADGIPGARLEIVKGCGHLLPFEEPELIGRRIVTWCQEKQS